MSRVDRGWGGWAVAERAFPLTTGDCVNSWSKGLGGVQGVRSNVHDSFPVSWSFTSLINPTSLRTIAKASGKWCVHGASSACPLDSAS